MSNGSTPQLHSEPVLKRPGPGRLDLAFSVSNGVTRPVRSLANPPIQLSRVRYDDQNRPDLAVCTLLHLGGILEGDQNTLRVELGPNAAARIVMAAATQVYRMPSGDARQSLEIMLEAGSRLVWLGEPLILFGGSRFTQETRITLAPGARLVFLDLLSPGRLARGEVHQFERYETRFEVNNTGGLCLMAEYAMLEPRRSNPAAAGVLGDLPVYGSLYLLGSQVDAERGAACVAEMGEPATGATVLPNGCGLLVRALGQAPSELRSRLLRVMQQLEAKKIADSR